MDHLTLFSAWHDINYASRIFYVMLNMDQYGSTYKKCDVHHIIGIKLQDTRTHRPAPQALLIRRITATAKAWKWSNTHAPPVSCSPGGGDLDSTVRALPPCPPWHRSKIFPKIRLVLVLTCLAVNVPKPAITAIIALSYFSFRANLTTF